MKGFLTLSGFVMISWLMVKVHERGRRVGLRDPVVIEWMLDEGASSIPRAMSRGWFRCYRYSRFQWRCKVRYVCILRLSFHEGKSDGRKHEGSKSTEGTD